MGSIDDIRLGSKYVSEERLWKKTQLLEKSFGWVSKCISNFRQFYNLPGGIW